MLLASCADPVESRPAGDRSEGQACFDRALYHRYAYPRQQTLRLEPEAFASCLHSALLRRQEGGNPARWQRHRDEFPELLGYLAGSVETSYASGREDQLEDWLLAQDNASVTPVDLFSATLPLVEDDVFLAVLTAHELLRRAARFCSDYVQVTGYVTSYDAQTRLANQLIDIRGDLVERGPAFTGDHLGSWYRIWAMMLLDMTLAPVDEAGATAAHPGFQVARATAAALGQLVEARKAVTGSDDRDTGKAALNLAAGETMHALLMRVFASPATADAPCATDAYLLPVQ